MFFFLKKVIPSVMAAKQGIIKAFAQPCNIRVGIRTSTRGNNGTKQEVIATIHIALINKAFLFVTRSTIAPAKLIAI